MNGPPLRVTSKIEANWKPVPICFIPNSKKKRVSLYIDLFNPGFNNNHLLYKSSRHKFNSL